MTTVVDPKKFGLHPSTRIADLGEDAYAIVIRRKSRIIMKDGRNILAKVEKIQAQVPDARISVRTTAPVCSKTRAFLGEKGIDIHTI
jgi:hypothetical protein